MANALAADEDALGTRVRFVAFGAEEVGLVGSSVEAERTNRDAVKAVVNVDPNVLGRTLQLQTHGFDALTAAAERVGVTGYVVSGKSEGRGRGWGHTFADTFEKVEVRNLGEQAVLLAALVAGLADDDAAVARWDPAEIAAALEAQELATGMRVTGDWPYAEDGAATE